MDPSPQRHYTPYDMDEEHNRISSEDEYIAGEYFLANTTWYADTAFDPIHLYHSAGVRPMRIRIVGLLSATNLKLDSHGDFDPESSEGQRSQLSNASFRISLEEPKDPIHWAFALDFKKAVERVKTLVKFLPMESPVLNPLLVERDGVFSFNFSRPIFQKINYPYRFIQFGPNIGTQLPLGPYSLEGYNIRAGFQKYLDSIVRSHYARGTGVWDRKGVAISPRSREYFLAENLVEVEFEVTYIRNVGLVASFHEISIVY